MLALVAVFAVPAMRVEEVIVLFSATLPIVSVSLFDDVKGVSVGTRLLCHFLAAFVVLTSIGIIDWSLLLGDNHTTRPYHLLFAGAAVFWIVGSTNVFNFMDGINGIAASQAVLVGIGLALLGGLTAGISGLPPLLFSLALAGAALGFLPHNFPVPRMFMGDVGSAPLGFMLGVITLWIAKGVGWWLLVPLALLHANFVLDAGITLIRRIALGQRWYEPHREHFYQRLVRSGKSHTFATSMEMMLQTIVLALMVLYLFVPFGIRMILVVSVFSIWFGFFLYCEYRFRVAIALQRRKVERVEELAGIL